MESKDDNDFQPNSEEKNDEEERASAAIESNEAGKKSS